MSMNGDAKGRAHRALDRITRKPQAATLGWRKAADNVVIDAPGGLGRVYITWRPGGPVIPAVNSAGVPLAPLLPVWVVPGAPPQIVGIDYTDPAAVTAVIPSPYGVFPHHATHQHGGTDEVATATPGANAIPKADASGTLDDWVTPPPVTSVNGEIGDVVLDADDIAETASRIWFSSAEETKLAGIEAGADVTDATNIGSSIAGASSSATLLDTDKIPFVMGTTLMWILWSNVKSLLTTLFNTLYVLLAGKSGGQTIYGGTDANDDLVLEPTSHATKTSAYVKLAPSGGNVGIGDVSAPDNLVTMQAVSGWTLAKVIANAAAAAAAFFYVPFGTVSSTNPSWFAGLKASFHGFYSIWQFNGSAHEDNAVTIDAENRVGIGVGQITPWGRLHVREGSANHMFYRHESIVGTAITIIDGTLSGDVVRGVYISGVAYNTAGDFQAMEFAVANGASHVVQGGVSAGLRDLTFTVAANGTLTVQRTGSGTQTWSISATFTWL